MKPLEVLETVQARVGLEKHDSKIEFNMRTGRVDGPKFISIGSARNLIFVSKNDDRIFYRVGTPLLSMLVSIEMDNYDDVDDDVDGDETISVRFNVGMVNLDDEGKVLDESTTDEKRILVSCNTVSNQVISIDLSNPKVVKFIDSCHAKFKKIVDLKSAMPDQFEADGVRFEKIDDDTLLQHNYELSAIDLTVIGYVGRTSTSETLIYLSVEDGFGSFKIEAQHSVSYPKRTIDTKSADKFFSTNTASVISRFIKLFREFKFEVPKYTKIPSSLSVDLQVGQTTQLDLHAQIVDSEDFIKELQQLVSKYKFKIKQHGALK